MKRFFLLIMVAIATLFASCKNDDISIKRDTNFRINLATIMEPFTYELENEELVNEILGEVRVQLFVYDLEGTLVTSQTHFADNYVAIINTSLPINNGNYKVLVVTDVVDRDGDNITRDFWKFNDVEHLNKFTITDSDAYWPHVFLSMMGIKLQDVEINSTSNNVINIDVEPAGAVILNIAHNYNTYSDIEYITLRSSKYMQSILLNNEGEYNYQKYPLESGTTKLLQRIEPNPQYKGGRGYVFMLPTADVEFDYVAKLDNGDIVYLSEEMPANLNRGDEWYIFIDLCDEETNEITYSCTKVNDSSISSTRSVSTEYSKIEGAESKIYKIIDLI